NFLGYWDHYLSWSLYSGKILVMDICFDDRKYPQLVPYAAEKDEICTGKKKVNLQHWSLTELGVPPYPEPRVYKKVALQLHETFPGSRFVQYYQKANY